jgi:hypothetical protein
MQDIGWFNLIIAEAGIERLTPNILQPSISYS